MIITPLVETGDWRPPNLGNVIFDIFILVELAAFLLIFYMFFIMFGTFTTITIDKENIHLYGKHSIHIIIPFNNISFFEVRSLRTDNASMSNSVGRIVSIHLKSGKRVRLKTARSIFFNSSRTVMENDLINTINAPMRASKTNEENRM